MTGRDLPERQNGTRTSAVPRGKRGRSRDPLRAGARNCSAPPTPRTRVVKIGGSLLSDGVLESRLRSWFDAQTPCGNWVVVGGGALANAVRELDRRYGLSAQAAHQQAVRAMQVNAFVLSRLRDDFTWVSRLDDSDVLLRDNAAQRPRQYAVLDPVPFLTHDEPEFAGEPLPCGWQVTSDSIAARLAQVVGAFELVLLKSTLPTRDGGSVLVRDAAEDGYVDEHFPSAAAQLPHVRAVNLRDPAFPEVRLV